MIDPVLNQTVRHQVDLAAYHNFVLSKMIRVLNLSDADLLAELQKALTEEDEDSFKVQRLDRMLKSVQEINTEAYAQFYGAMSDEIKDYSAYESGFQFDLYKSVLPISAELARVVPEQVYAAAMAQPFEGRLLKDWASSLAASRLRNIKDTIAVGYTNGKTTSEIITEIRGTKALRYADGLLDTSRRNLEPIVRTALSHTAQLARTKFGEKNKDIVDEEMWVSTLDGRTSSLCRVRDHLHYTAIDHKPVGHEVPWGAGPGRLHFSCRSTSILLLKGQKKLFGTRASATGPVDANMSYNDWLKEQSPEVQDDILGKKRGAQYRAEGMAIDRFVNDKGRQLSLAQLRERDEKAFNQPTKGFTVYDPGHPRVEPDVSTPARKAAVALEEKIRRNDMETGIAIDADGSVLLSRKGRADQVGFTESEFRVMRGTLFTHNHPGNGTFSIEDGARAHEANFVELRAVGPNLRYIMQAPNGWPTEAQLNQSKKSLTPLLQKKVDAMINVGELEKKFAQQEMEHQFWVEVAKKYGMLYTREAS